MNFDTLVRLTMAFHVEDRKHGDHTYHLAWCPTHDGDIHKVMIIPHSDDGNNHEQELNIALHLVAALYKENKIHLVDRITATEFSVNIIAPKWPEVVEYCESFHSKNLVGNEDRPYRTFYIDSPNHSFDMDFATSKDDYEFNIIPSEYFDFVIGDDEKFFFWDSQTEYLVRELDVRLE